MPLIKDKTHPLQRANCFFLKLSPHVYSAPKGTLSCWGSSDIMLLPLQSRVLPLLQGPIQRPVPVFLNKRVHTVQRRSALPRTYCALAKFGYGSDITQCQAHSVRLKHYCSLRSKQNTQRRKHCLTHNSFPFASFQTTCPAREAIVPRNSQLRKASRVRYVTSWCFNSRNVWENDNIWYNKTQHHFFKRHMWKRPRQEKVNTLCFFPVLVRVYYYVGYVFSGLLPSRNVRFIQRTKKRRDGDN